MSKISTSDVNHPQYKESEALQRLLESLDAALAEQNARFDDADISPSYDQIVISVGGESIAFLLGGPQTQGINEFVESIAADNGYAFNFHNQTVVE